MDSDWLTINDEWKLLLELVLTINDQQKLLFSLTLPNYGSGDTTSEVSYHLTLFTNFTTQESKKP